MYYVYILISLKDGNLYTGSTPNLKTRLKRHNLGYVISTKNRRPLKLIYYECYSNSVDAKKREQYLKGGNGHEQTKIQLKQTLKIVNYKHRY